MKEGLKRRGRVHIYMISVHSSLADQTLTHSGEGLVHYVQLIVLADSGCRVYTQSHGTQTTYTFGGKHPTKVVGSGTNRCIVKYQTLP